MKKQFLSLMMLLAACTMEAADNFITFNKDNNATIELSAGGTVTYDANDYEGVLIAIANLKTDMKAVMGHDRCRHYEGRQEHG